MSRYSLLKTGSIFEVYVTATGIEPTTTKIVNKHSTICLQTKWLWVQFLLLSQVPNNLQKAI